MLAIYNIESRRFRDTLEKLRQLQQPSATAGLKLQSNVAKDETQQVLVTIIIKAAVTVSSPAERKGYERRKSEG